MISTLNAQIISHLENFLSETGTLQKHLSKWTEDSKKYQTNELDICAIQVLGGKFTTGVGNNHLQQAAIILLQKIRRTRTRSVRSARNQLDDEIQIEMTRQQTSKKFSYNAIIERASNSLVGLECPTVFHVFPATIGGPKVDTEFSIGSVRVLSRSYFERQFGTSFENKIADNKHARSTRNLLSYWRQYSAEYQYFMIVEVADHEYELGREVAEEAAELVLNQLRMMAGHRDGPRIRLSTGLQPQRRKSELAISAEGKAILREIITPGGAIFDETWKEVFLSRLGRTREMLVNITRHYVGGKSWHDPVFERVRYSNHLITDAYGDAWDRSRLVKLIAALETLSVLPRDAKSDNLAMRCALAVRAEWLSDHQLVKQRILAAYKVRNKIVHGDTPSDETVTKVLVDLHEVLSAVVVSLMGALGQVLTEKEPQSQRALRREMKLFYETLIPPLE